MRNVKPAVAIGRFVNGRQPSALYKLLVEKLPEHRFQEKGRDILDVEKIAADLVVKNKQTVYVWTKKNCIPANRMRQFIALVGSKLTVEDLTPFITSK
ncbi:MULTISPECIES: hypothetical protein [Brucella/Ochrobactrum group]|jgi:hypothetical protein|uniref:hypothetical protein n=1 Tax=Ochrobactrum sp. BTU2 TaxID=2856166 RepID=UPI00211A7545|nr:hypothetical protein [Ochrobactrum sp. BTU2]MCQ9146109.1 hypothetical protein [Ochrobactrum sp. BTU2]